MPLVSTGSFAKALWPGVKTWYGHAYNEHPVEWSQIFSQEKSNKAFEEDVSISGTGLAVVKDEGDSITYDEMSQEFVTRYVMVVYGLGMIITREAYEDAMESGGLGRLGKRGSEALAFSIRQTKENVAANVLNRAFNSSYTGGDGVELCSTAHLAKNGPNYSNALSPAAALSEAAAEDMVIQAKKLTNARGLNVSIGIDCLIIPVDLAFEAERIFKSQLRVDTANNDTNALRTMGSVPKIVANHYLNSTTRWFMKTTCKDGLKMYQRRNTELRTDNDFDTENAKYKTTERYSFGFTDPRGVLGSNAA